MKKILISSLSLGVIIATGSPVFAKINFDSITKTQQEIVEKTAQPSQANSVASVNNIEPTQDVQSETEVTVPVTAESAQETIETKIATVTPGMTESMNTTEEIPSKDQSILPEVISSNDEIPSSESANTIDIEKTSELDKDQVSTEPQLTTESVDLALVKAELEELRAEKKSVDNELADAKNRLKKLFDNLDTGTQNALKELHKENEELNKYFSQAKNEKKDLYRRYSWSRYMETNCGNTLGCR